MRLCVCQDYVREFVANVLVSAFPHLQACVGLQRVSPAMGTGALMATAVLCRDQLKLIVQGFFTFDTDPARFKSHLRDFLVQCRVRVIGVLVCACVPGREPTCCGGGGGRVGRLGLQEAFGLDLDGLFLSERSEQLEKAQREKLERFAASPGMLRPQDLAMDD